MNIDQAKTEFGSKEIPVVFFDNDLEPFWHNENGAEIYGVLKSVITEDTKQWVQQKLALFYSARLGLSDFLGMNDELVWIKTEFGSVAMVDSTGRETLAGVHYAVDGTDRLGDEVRSDIETLLLNSVALERRINSDEPEVESGFEELRRGAYRMLRTITNATLVSRYYSGDLETRLMMCDVGEVVSDICDAAKSVCQKRLNIEVSVPKEQVLAAIDVELFKRALLNLILNAVKFQQDDGVVRVSVLSAGEFVTVSVKDNGKGIREHNLSRVQEPYFSCEPADEGGEKPGLGLGVTIASIFCKTHGGYVVTESEFGKGTSVSLTFKNGREHNAPELRESAAQYVTDRRSRIYVELCDISILPN